MIHLFLLQYCARCFDKSACCYDTLTSNPQVIPNGSFKGLKSA